MFSFILEFEVKEDQLKTDSILPDDQFYNNLNTFCCVQDTTVSLNSSSKSSNFAVTSSFGSSVVCCFAGHDLSIRRSKKYSLTLQHDSNCFSGIL